MKIIKKPWGAEIIYAHDNGLYIGKKIIIPKGNRISLQSHVKKHETFYLDKGTAEFRIGKKISEISDRDPQENRSVIINPGVKHRIRAITDCVILESSTDYPNDVCRYEDDYGRESEKSKFKKISLKS